MKICIYSYFVPLKQHQAGGAQLFLHNLITGLLAYGEQITVLCPRTAEADVLELPDLEVRPIIYEAAGRQLALYERSSNLRTLAEAAHDCDLVISIDRAIPINLPQPKVLLLQTIAYPNVVDSLLSLSWDTLIVPSAYLAGIIEAILPPASWSETPPPITVIPNGIDTDHFALCDPEPLLRQLGLSTAKRYLLFPHRPEPAKGFEDALNAMSLLSHEEGTPYQLLVPTEPRSNKASRGPEAAYIYSLKRHVVSRGIDHLVHFHPWVSADLLPAYFGLGSWCLTLSLLPEGFGYTPLQSIACGTPVISTTCGALRDHLPTGHGLRYVEPHAPEQITLSFGDLPSHDELRRGRAYIKTHYDLSFSIQKYRSVLHGVRKCHSFYTPFAERRNIRLAPWCRPYRDELIWNDFSMRYQKLTLAEGRIVQELAVRETIPATAYNRTVVERLRKKGIILET